MEKKIIPCVVAVLILFSSIALAQDTLYYKTHSLTFKTQFFQIKDAVNYGLVFSGLNLMAGYSYTQVSKKHLFIYSPELGFGVGSNKGTSLAWRFRPIDLFYGFTSKSSRFSIGAYAASDYQWQQYSELQGGRLFWFTSIEAGPQFMYRLPYRSTWIKLAFSNSLAGFTSRPEPAAEAYFYAFNVAEFFSSAHRHLTFGSYNLFNHTQLEIEFPHHPEKRFSIAYAFEYFGYYQSPTLSYLNHSLNFKWKIGKL